VRRHIASLAVALAICALVVAARAAGWLQRVENIGADVRAGLLRHTVPSDIVIVGLDARSLTELSSWPWPRSYHARALRTLLLAAPREVFIDIDFSSSSDPTDDALLEEALAGHGSVPVVLPEFFQPLSGADDQVLVTRPLERLARHATLASVNLQPDADGLVRSVPLAWRRDGFSQPSVAAALALTPLPRDQEYLALTDYAISPESFAFVSYADVLAGRVPARAFTGKTVLVGATAIELHDLVAVPLYRSLSGVVVQALALQTLRMGGLRATPQGLYFPALVLWTFGLVVLFGAQSWRRNLVALAAAALLLVALQLGAYAFFRLVIEVVPAALALAAAFTVTTLRSLDEQTLRAFAYSLGLRRRDALLKSIVESSTDCILCIDARGRIQTANPAAARLFGVAPEALPGTNIGRHLPELVTAAAPDAAEVLESLSGTLCECEARTAADRLLPVEISFARAGINDERLYTAIIRDISERKAQQRELEFRATHDPLTALPNRAALDTCLERSLATASDAAPLALLMLDLSRFKEVNDTLGHSVGDRVLQEVAQRFVTTVGDRGLVARIGGDEFTVVVYDARDAGGVVRLAEELAGSLRASIDLGGVSIDVGVNTGIAFYPLDAPDAQTLLRHADVAMYLAKRRGSASERYDAAHDGHSVRKLAMVHELRTAIGCGGLQLHYQPQISLRRGTAEAVEALVRWEHPTLGKVNPSEFVAIAEATDLIRPLTEFTFSEALAQAARWRRTGLELRVAVNLSARMLHDPELARRLASLLAASGVEPSSLEVEITESAVMLDPPRALRIVREIHDLGVLVSVDDYGTGFSALGYLRDLPVHGLKLDRSFVGGMHTRKGDRVIVESTVRMAHALELQVVAEGVESDWDVHVVAGAGCDFAQGFHFSRPLPAAACAQWISSFNGAGAGVQYSNTGKSRSRTGNRTVQ
jgi:diguanylate cyclase (GGDEF)-like protein/PAS domain S-box-containing protein